VQNLPDWISNQLGPHVEPQSRRLEAERVDPETEHAIEREICSKVRRSSASMLSLIALSM